MNKFSLTYARSHGRIYYHCVNPRVPVSPGTSDAEYSLQEKILPGQGNRQELQEEAQRSIVDGQSLL